uniref:Uncharacterized protein n=1 Tax=Sanya narnavirus 8 TaxID=2905320 RepID=A0A8K1XG71_9VIRU|nr:MAG: hypothetical protein SaNV8_gp2 [Sanya narnavirus 8]
MAPNRSVTNETRTLGRLQRLNAPWLGREVPPERVPYALKHPRIRWRVEHIHPACILGGVNFINVIDESVKLRADNLGHVAHPFARMAKTAKSRGELRWSTKSSCLGSHAFTEDSGYTPQCLPLWCKVVALVHDSSTVAHELLERVRVEVPTPAVGADEAKRLAKRPTLLAKKGFPLMQSTAYRCYSLRVGSNITGSGNTQHVISADGGQAAEYPTAPAIDQSEHRKGQWCPHEAPTLHRDQDMCGPFSDQTRNVVQPLDVSFGERRKTVSDIVLPLANAKAVAREVKVGRVQARLAKTAEDGLDSTMSEPVCRLRQISTKIVLITTQGTREAAYQPSCTLDPTRELVGTRVLSSNNWEDTLAGQCPCSKETTGRYGNHTDLRALLSQWSGVVRHHGARTYRGRPEVFHRKQGAIPCQDIWILLVLKRSCSTLAEKAVQERVLPGEGRRTTGYCQDPDLHLRPHHVAVQIGSYPIAKVLVVPPFRPWALFHRVLARRTMCPSKLLSQRITHEVNHVVFESGLDVVRNYELTGDVGSMVQKSTRDDGSSGLRQGAGASREREAAPWRLPDNPSKPSLYLHGHTRGITDFPIRECNITKGHREVFNDLRQPVGTAGAGADNPAPERPATMLLRNSTGNETRPHSLPDSCGAIDTTPMGLLPPRFLEEGRGTYYTAKKK